MTSGSQKFLVHQYLIIKNKKMENLKTFKYFFFRDTHSSLPISININTGETQIYTNNEIRPPVSYIVSLWSTLRN